MSSEHFWLPATWHDQVIGVHDDLLEHEDREEKCTYIHKYFINEGCPTHTKIAVEETEGVALIDQRLFVFLLVFPVLPNDNLICPFLKLCVKFNDRIRVDDNIYP